MFQYYQTTEEGKWRAIPATPDVEQKALAAGAKKLSILAVSEQVDPDQDQSDTLSHKGPLYFDIDYKGDLGEAIRSAKDLIKTLVEHYEVPKDAIWPFCSGSKGIHILIPETVFSSGRAMKSLHKVYAVMATYLGVLGMDYQVYSGGKGNCFRLANVQRYDGNYRVPITIDELSTLTAESYLEFVSKPRHLTRPSVEGIEAPMLAALFETAKRQAKEKDRVLDSVPEEKLAAIRDTPPACVLQVSSGKGNNSLNYNQKAMQIAIWAARSGAPESLGRAQISLLAEKEESSQYNDKRVRYNHGLSLLKYMERNKSKKFSCAAMRSVCSAYPCEGCPLEKGIQEEVTTEDMAADFGIYQDVDGYFVPTEKNRRGRRISNFTVRAKDQVVEFPEDGRAPVRVGLTLELLNHKGDVENTTTVDESAFDSRSGFLTMARGIGDCTFLGSETDVQKIKMLVLSGRETMNEVRRVYSFGIHFDAFGNSGKKIRTYVEPGWSLNEFKVENTHTFSGTPVAPPRMNQMPSLQKGDAEAAAALRAAFGLTRKAVIGQLIGWYASAHLRQHFHQVSNQFPLLSVWGKAGSGKTTITCAISGLAGVSYSDDDGLLNVALTRKPFAIGEFLSSSKTLPRILDEYNKSKMVGDMYTIVGEMLKGSFNQQSMGSGTIARSDNVNGRGRNGTAVVRTQMSAPVIVLSEAPPEMPAVIQRAVLVKVTAADRIAVNGQQALDDLMDSRDGLQRVGKALMLAALSTPPEKVKALMQGVMEFVPQGMPERPRFCYAAILVGLVFLRETCKGYELDVEEDINELFSAVVTELQEKGQSLARAKHRTEVDAVLEKVLEMIELTTHDMADALKAGVHYSVDSLDGRRVLYLDLPIVHTLYKRYTRHERNGVALESYGVFSELLTEEEYFISSRSLSPASMHCDRTVWALDVDTMIDKGLRAAEGLV